MTDHQWRQAIKDEILGIVRNQCFVPTNALPPGRRALTTKLIFKTKRDADGAPNRRKARLVVRGFLQQYGVDYFNTYSPVIGSPALRLLIASAAILKCSFHTYDITQAYLNGDIDAEIYVKLPKEIQPLLNEITSAEPSITFGPIQKLQKGLYGLKQAGRIWNNKLVDILLKIGLQQTQIEPCLFFKRNQKEFLYLLVYVDDIVMVTNSPNLEQHVIQAIQNCGITISRSSNNQILGLKVHRPTPNEIFVQQGRYINDKAKAFGLDDSKYTDNPSIGPLSETGVSGDLKVQQSICGSITYAATMTRPDVAFTTSIVARFNSRPTQQSINAGKRVIQYLHTTHNLGIRYTNTPILECFVDADFASDPSTANKRRSRSGAIIKLGGGPIWWLSKSQTITALSSTEAELVAAHEGSTQLLWFQRLISECHLDQILQLPNSAPIFIDNQSTIAMIESDHPTKRSKHIDIRFFRIKDHIATGKQHVVYVPSADNLADILTKPLPAHKLRTMRAAIGLLPVPPNTARRGASQYSRSNQTETNDHETSNICETYI
jgi:hypothetical protein